MLLVNTFLIMCSSYSPSRMFLVKWDLCWYAITCYYVLVVTRVKALSLSVFVSSCAILQSKIIFKIQLNLLKLACLQVRETRRGPGDSAFTTCGEDITKLTLTYNHKLLLSLSCAHMMIYHSSITWTLRTANHLTILLCSRTYQRKIDVRCYVIIRFNIWVLCGVKHQVHFCIICNL